MKHLIKFLTIAMMAVTFNANAAFISFNAGDFKFTGDTYIDTTQPAETRAIGRVTTITQGGSILWSNGDGGDYINFSASGITPVVSPVAPTFNFVGTGGIINFYDNTSDIFDPSQDYATQTALYQAGTDYLTALIHGDVIGIATSLSYSANGFADVVSGTIASILDTNSRVAFDGALTDITFGLSGAANNNPLVNPDYQYIVSVDAQGQASPVPSPEPLALIGLGLIGVGMASRKKQVL